MLIFTQQYSEVRKAAAPCDNLSCLEGENRLGGGTLNAIILQVLPLAVSMPYISFVHAAQHLHLHCFPHELSILGYARLSHT